MSGLSTTQILAPSRAVCGRGKRLRSIEILRFKKNDNLGGVISAAKQVLLAEPCVGAHGLMIVVRGFPSFEVPHFAPALA
jgi:hypothetical protein